MLSTALLALFGRGDDEAALLLGLVVASGALCTALSGLLARGDRPSVPLHALLGAAAGLAGAALLDGGDGYALVIALVAGPLGLLGGLLAATVARLTPRRALVPVLALSVLVCGGVLVAGELGRRPPHPGSYLVVEGVEGLDALAVAQRAAARLGASGEPLADRTWSDVAGSVLPTPLPEGAGAEYGYVATADERRITVDVESDLACVLVTRDDARALDGPCPQAGG